MRVLATLIDTTTRSGSKLTPTFMQNDGVNGLRFVDVRARARRKGQDWHAVRRDLERLLQA
jgi:hypothetical protein